jgi:hypothetical protein
VSVAAGTWEPSDAEEGDDEPAEAAQPEDPQPHYANLVEFVTDHLSPLVRRRAGGGRTWCGEWWRHPEAVERLTTLWHAWETLRIEGGTAMSNWWVYHFDPHFAVLSDSERGPFQACSRDGHSDQLKPLPNDPLPQEWRWAWGVAAHDERGEGDE